jgi:exodeoxyribonuclease VII small subunit
MSPRSKKIAETASSYEDSFAELQTIVAKLESGTATLDEALAYYARGKELVKTCSDLLAKAELRVRELSPLSAEGSQDESMGGYKPE